MLRWAALAAVLAAAVCADESFDHAVSVDADGRTNEYSHHLESEPLSLSEITPHWSLDDAALLPQQHVTNSQPSQSEEDESADDESTDDDGDDEESSEEAVGTEKGNFSFSYRQHVTGSTPTGPLGIGTPSVGLNMILDTGSDKFVAKTWSTIKAELDKIDAGASEEVFPGNKIYNHNSSKSYMQLFASQHGRKVPRQGFIAYGSGMAITLEGKETIRVGTDERFISMHKFPISEISLDSLQILHSSKGISGILGLQHMMNRSLGQSFYSVLRDKGILNSFGYCRGKDNDGTFIWGEKSSDGKAVDVAGQMHWAVTVKNMHVKKHKHHATSFMERFDARSSDEEDADVFLEQENHSHSKFHKFHICRKSQCVAVIDTGSNIIAMPSEAVRTLTKILDVATDCSNMEHLPNLHFVLGDDMHVSLPPSAYIMKVQMPRLKEDPNSQAEDSEMRSATSENADANLEEDDDDEASDDAKAVGSTRFRMARRHEAAELTEEEAREAQEAQTQRYQAQVDSLVEDTYREHGLDLRAVLRVDLTQFLLNSSTLCMPAIVPLDRETQKGTLLVIGGPLFEKYYTRWSWPTGEKPKVYMKNLHKAETCMVKEEEEEEDTGGSKSSAPKMTVWRSHQKGRMIRAEKIKQRHSAELSEMSATLKLREISLDEIRYPHWAKYIDDL